VGQIILVTSSTGLDECNMANVFMLEAYLKRVSTLNY